MIRQGEAWWRVALPAVFVLLSLTYAGYQHYQLPLDGDMAPIIVPNEAYTRVLTDPLGLGVLLRNEVYAAPNRYSAHALMRAYFLYVPQALQQVVAPITSVYLAGALFKTALQALLLFLLAVYASGTSRLRESRFWLAAALLVPLFQIAGYQQQMGVVLNSITYSFFYPLPLALLLLGFLPFYLAARQRRAVRLSGVGWGALALLAVGLALSGPLVPGVAGLVLAGAWLAWSSAQLRAPTEISWGKRMTQLLAKLPWPTLLLSVWFGAWCLYSLYIGRNNAENFPATVSLATRYSLLPRGLFHQLTVRIGLPLLVLALLGSNVLLQRRHAEASTPEKYWWKSALRWLGLFAVVYIMLLPMGGYRPYRELIVRGDTIMPITLALMALYAGVGVALLHCLPTRSRRWYALGLVGVSAIFLNATRAVALADSNACERQALELLARSAAPVVKLPQDCRVLAWQTISTPDASTVNGKLLAYWHVTTSVKRYYYDSNAPAEPGSFSTPPQK